MFYWVGFMATNKPPQPIWLDHSGTTCTFSIGEQYSYDPEATGKCSLTNSGIKMTFASRPAVHVNVYEVKDFGPIDFVPVAD